MGGHEILRENKARATEADGPRVVEKEKEREKWIEFADGSRRQLLGLEF